MHALEQRGAIMGVGADHDRFVRKLKEEVVGAAEKRQVAADTAAAAAAAAPADTTTAARGRGGRVADAAATDAPANVIPESVVISNGSRLTMIGTTVVGQDVAGPADLATATNAGAAPNTTPAAEPSVISPIQNTKADDTPTAITVTVQPTATSNASNAAANANKSGSSDGSSHTGLVTGIIVAAVLVVLLLGGFWFFKKRQSRRDADSPDSNFGGAGAFKKHNDEDDDDGEFFGGSAQQDTSYGSMQNEKSGSWDQNMAPSYRSDPASAGPQRMSQQFGGQQQQKIVPSMSNASLGQPSYPPSAPMGAGKGPTQNILAPQNQPNNYPLQQQQRQQQARAQSPFEDPKPYQNGLPRAMSPIKQQTYYSSSASQQSAQHLNEPYYSSPLPSLTRANAPSPIGHGYPLSAGAVAVAGTAAGATGLAHAQQHQSKPQVQQSQPQQAPQTKTSTIEPINEAKNQAQSAGTEKPQSPFMDSPSQGKIYFTKNTFNRTQPDELLIYPGDRIQILVSYDDGWALGVNLDSGTPPSKGVFPLDCVTDDIPASAKPSSAEPVTSQAKSSSEQDRSAPLDDYVSGNAFSTPTYSVAPQLGPLPIRSDSPFDAHFAAPPSPGGPKSPTTRTAAPTPPPPSITISSPSMNQLPQTGSSNSLSAVPTSLTPGSQRSSLAGESRSVKRTSSLVATRDANLFVALGEVLGDADDKQTRNV